jgi:drug/metabolite transporter (DMT)-like permease
VAGRPPARDRHGLGVALILAMGVCFASLDTTAKYLGQTLTVSLVLASRYTVQALVMGLWLLLHRQLRGVNLFASAHPRFQALRGALLLLTSALLFAGIQHMPVAEFTAVGMLAPVLVSLLAAVFLHERLTPLRALMVAGGFAGALIVVRPGSGLFGWVALVPLAMAFVYANYQLLTRRLAGLEHPLTTHFYTGAVGAAIMLVVLAALPGEPLAVLARAPVSTWALLLMAGLLGTAGHLFLILAVGMAPLATLMPFTYAQIGFASFTGWLVFGHVPDAWAFVGMAVVAACGAASVWLTLREQNAAPSELSPAVD